MVSNGRYICIMLSFRFLIFSIAAKTLVSIEETSAKPLLRDIYVLTNFAQTVKTSDSVEEKQHV